MPDCTNDTMRDLLPALARGELSGAEEASVRGHLATCSDCAEEFELLGAAGRLFATATPTVNIESVLAKLPAPPTARPVLRVERGRARPARVPRYVLAAAASLLMVATLSLAVLRPVFFGAPAVGVDIAAVDSGLASAPSVSVALVGGSDLSDLGIEELTQLLAELDRMEATIAAEPITMRQPLIADQEGL